MSGPEWVALGIFDNPVFQSELLFLLVIIMLFGAIGVIVGRSMTLGVFGGFLTFVHIVTAVGSNVPELDVAMWAILGILILFVMFRLWGHTTGGSPG